MNFMEGFIMLKKIALVTIGLASAYITCWFAGEGIAAHLFDDDLEEI